jgi:hypothetical protein
VAGAGSRGAEGAAFGREALDAVAGTWYAGAPVAGREVRELIEAAGATLRFLPPSSHDLNPIEPG